SAEGQRDRRQHPAGRAERARSAAHLAHLHRARRRARARGCARQRSPRHEGPEQPLPRRRDPALMLQTTFNGIITGVIMTLPALAVTLLFGVLKFPNFAVGAMMTVAAYLAFALNAQLGLPLAAATALAAPAMGVLCIGIDQVTFRPLRERGAITLMVASLGLAFILENVARFAYGNSARSFAVELARPFRVAGVRMNQEQMITIAVSAAAMIAMYVLLTRMPMGRAMRAVADNPSLAL